MPPNDNDDDKKDDKNDKKDDKNDKKNTNDTDKKTDDDADDKSTSLDDLPDKAQKYFRQLRDENKRRRIENEALTKKMDEWQTNIRKVFGGDDPDDKQTPEELLAQVQAENEELYFQQSLLETANENKIPQSKFDYFRYLITVELGKIPEGQEMPKEVLQRIVNEVLSVSGTQKKSSGGGSSTVDDKAPDDGKDLASTTYEEYLAMNVIEQQNFYESSPDLYMKYFNKQRTEGKLPGRA